MKDDMISRQAAVETVRKAQSIGQAHRMLIQLPSELPNLDEWCDDCKEYDKERHSRPRWNRVIRQTVEDMKAAQPGWIPVTERLPKPNEYENGVLKYYLVQNEYGDMMVCSWDGCFWTQMYRITHVVDKVVAWMPLPTPYREGGQDNGIDTE